MTTPPDKLETAQEFAIRLWGTTFTYPSDVTPLIEQRDAAIRAEAYSAGYEMGRRNALIKAASIAEDMASRGMAGERFALIEAAKRMRMLAGPPKDPNG